MDNKVSVIIPTFKRNKELCETLEYLFNQEFKNFEIIVVDQMPNHDADTEDFLEKNKNKFKYIKTNKSGLCYARNIGIKEAEGNILIFIDDDVILKEDFIKRYVEIFDNNDIYVVAGSELTFLHNKHKNVECEIAFLWGRAKINYFSNKECFVRGFKGCNFALKKEIIDEIGFFDEKIPAPYIREDTDMAYRIIKKGYKIFYSPKTFLFHKQVSNGGTMVFKNSTKSISKREPWLNDNSYVCEIYFQIKHFGKSSLLLYIPFLYIQWVFLKNVKSLNKFLEANKVFFKGIFKGVYYWKKVKE